MLGTKVKSSKMTRVCQADSGEWRWCAGPIWEGIQAGIKQEGQHEQL